ncbi:LuxR C-terminal-related transcriptional regulator [Acuticoccus kandeliae]|uniref:LuxR C-terminal-related transcriptional regulator n=1 Tax=Acuticoccus kandeliae TaxID=2073160 RepID=UPI00130091F2|nr:response regulator transcription factor [Acuticoccus kandeliae]
MAINEIVLIDPQSLVRECMARSISPICPDATVVEFDAVDSWLAVRDPDAAPLVIYNMPDDAGHDEAQIDALREFIHKAQPAKVIVLARSNDVLCMIDAIECGAVGYIPMGAKLDDLVSALRICAAGSVFVQRNTLMSLRDFVRPAASTKPQLSSYFTERQLAVARALRRGSANKTIAYELDLCESTVKVHIRNIMRKLKVSNRTQAAFKLNAFADDDEA